MQRIAGAACLFLGSVSAGFYAALREKRRLRLLLTFADALQTIRWELSASRTEAEQLLTKHLNRFGGSRGELIKRTDALPLRPAERELLKEFFTRFGEGGESCECERCSTLAKRLTEIAAQDREESGKKVKLYLSGGVLGGLFLSILMI